jgi:hypothetical protein
MAAPSRAYAVQGHDLVRSDLERPWLARLLRALLGERPRSLLDLGSGDALVERLAGARLDRYVGVDLGPPATVVHDLRDGLGPVGREPFDLYLGSFGIASHLPIASLKRLLREIARHARRGSIVALEALGARSLEWPGLWEVPAGPARTIPYRLGADVPVHPWTPEELFALFADAGIAPGWAVDRTLQAGPKTGDGRYWPGLPPLRDALNSLLAGDPSPQALDELRAPLPPLPAGPAAVLHHALASRRRALLDRGPRDPARALWRLEPSTSGGYGHGLMVVGRVEAQAASDGLNSASSRAKAPAGQSLATA